MTPDVCTSLFAAAKQALHGDLGGCMFADMNGEECCCAGVRADRP